MTVFVDDATALCDQRREPLERSLTEHLTALISFIFMGCKPAKPSQSRWTGMSHCAQWALALAMWHRILTPLFASLAARESKNMDTGNQTMDADVGGARPH